jgi:hypothetical protein
MENVFTSSTLHFKERTTFNLAVCILEKLEHEIGENLLDVGHSDMIISVFSDLGLQYVISELSVCQIWDKPSKLKGDADFYIDKVG